MAGASSDARLFDSSVLFGAVNARDANHDVALRLVKGVDGGTLPDAVVIESVLAETLNGIHGRVSHEAAVDFLDRLEANARFHVERRDDRQREGAIPHERTAVVRRRADRCCRTNGRYRVRVLVRRRFRRRDATRHARESVRSEE
ncbi:PilT protein domain-containing protein [Halococcus salifodinae DSM 8989]|uniref:PilT protein domain-containing protein n=1 Tax=Halococcus salifodinae DSM 8989 TaxID=1227456 RepID=M0N1X0_9EURY|nr:PilT protein domain-containing protein [Halococcus salifodinae DSM 8989]